LGSVKIALAVPGAADVPELPVTLFVTEIDPDVAEKLIVAPVTITLLEFTTVTTSGKVVPVPSDLADGVPTTKLI
jgi:hypothetical protein